MVFVNLYSSSEAAMASGAENLYSKLQKEGACVELLKGKDYGVNFNRLIIETPAYEILNFYIRPYQRKKDDINAELKIERLGINYLSFEEGEEAYAETAGLILHVVNKHEK